MTDPNNTNEDEFFDSATSEFPAKEDLEGRLVAIWNTGKEGTRVSQATNKPYPYVETITLVLDDGPDGYQATRRDGDPNLVASVAENGPQRLNGFQWSAIGLYSRVSKRKVGDRPMIGRINSRKNSIKGMADAWSIADMTEQDRVIARKHNALFYEITDEVQRTADDGAFA